MITMSGLPQKYAKLSKYLSYILRHEPEKAGLDLDREGFADIDAVLEALEDTEHLWSSIEDIEYLIDNSDKRRFEIKNGKIRALYGHSICVKIDKDEKPPVKLYHGTSPDSLPSILEDGLKPMGRQYVHLSISKKEALEVGKRHHPDPLILEVDSLAAWKNDIDFYDRGDVYLAKEIPPQYLDSIDNPG